VAGLVVGVSARRRVRRQADEFGADGGRERRRRDGMRGWGIADFYGIRVIARDDVAPFVRALSRGNVHGDPRVALRRFFHLGIRL
jgi:imidazolonepropionase-like amidohydrolase